MNSYICFSLFSSIVGCFFVFLFDCVIQVGIVFKAFYKIVLKRKENQNNVLLMILNPTLDCKSAHSNLTITRARSVEQTMSDTVLGRTASGPLGAT